MLNTERQRQSEHMHWVTGKMMMMVHQSPLCAEPVRSALVVIVIQIDAQTRMAPLL